MIDEPNKTDSPPRQVESKPLVRGKDMGPLWDRETDFVGQQKNLAKEDPSPTNNPFQLIALISVSFVLAFIIVSYVLKSPGKITEPPGKAPPYTILETEDFSLIGRRRVSLRVLIQDRNATDAQVRTALLDAAVKQDADAVLAFGYWPGDDWRSSYTAGKLEWGKNGGGWASTARLPVEGSYLAGKRPLARSGLEPSRLGNPNGRSRAENLEQEKSKCINFFYQAKEKLTKLQQRMNSLESITNDLEKTCCSYTLAHEFLDFDTFIRREVKVLDTQVENRDIRLELEKFKAEYAIAVEKILSHSSDLKALRDWNVMNDELPEWFLKGHQ
jgi:hypothetical protein